MSHPTCCCSESLDRCGRCDLLVDLEGFHLMSVARTSQALVLDIESCDCLAGCPGYGLNRSRPRTRGGGGDRRASGRGSCADPVAQYDAGSAENAPDRSCLSSSRTVRCTPPRALPSVRAIRCLTSRKPLSWAWPASEEPHGTPCGPISSRICKPHLMTPPVSQGFRNWELMRTYGTRTNAAAAHVNSPASWT